MFWMLHQLFNYLISTIFTVYVQYAIISDGIVQNPKKTTNLSYSQP